MAAVESEITNEKCTDKCADDEIVKSLQAERARCQEWENLMPMSSSEPSASSDSCLFLSTTQMWSSLPPSTWNGGSDDSVGKLALPWQQDGQSWWKSPVILNNKQRKELMAEHVGSTLQAIAEWVYPMSQLVAEYAFPPTEQYIRPLRLEEMLAVSGDLKHVSHCGYHWIRSSVPLGLPRASPLQLEPDRSMRCGWNTAPALAGLHLPVEPLQTTYVMVDLCCLEIAMPANYCIIVSYDVHKPVDVYVVALRRAGFGPESIELPQPSPATDLCYGLRTPAVPGSTRVTDLELKLHPFVIHTFLDPNSAHTNYKGFEETLYRRPPFPCDRTDRDMEDDAGLPQTLRILVHGVVYRLRWRYSPDWNVLLPIE